MTDATQNPSAIDHEAVILDELAIPTPEEVDAVFGDPSEAIKQVRMIGLDDESMAESIDDPTLSDDDYAQHVNTLHWNLTDTSAIDLSEVVYLAHNEPYKVDVIFKGQCTKVTLLMTTKHVPDFGALLASWSLAKEAAARLRRM